jgi:hypothetical protein
VIARYFLFIFSLLTILVLAGLIIKPVKVEDVKISGYKDPFSVARQVYSKMLWNDMQTERQVAKRFSIIQRVVDYTPGFKPAYDELCKDIQAYTSSDIQIKDLLKIAKLGAETFDDGKMLDCYVNTLTGMERYVEALNFLSQQYIQYQNTSRQDFYLDKIKKLQHEKNTLDLTKAVESYYQKTKAYPGDILVLINEGIIDKMPEDPYGGQYFISKQGQIRSTSEMTSNEN